MDHSQYFKGHARAKSALESIADMGRVPGSLLLHGPRGSGRVQLACWFAALVNGTARLDTIMSGEDPDVTVVSLASINEKSSRDRQYIGVDQIREMVDELHRAPMLGPRRFFVLDDADLLTRKASFALLKIAEEAPDRSTLVLVAENLTELTSTLRSRLVKIRARLSTDEVLEILREEKPEVDSDKIEAAARASGGSVGRALDLIDGELADVRKGAARMIVTAIQNRPHKYIQQARDLDTDEVGPHLRMVLEMLAEFVVHSRAPEAVRHIDVAGVWGRLSSGVDADPVELATVVQEWTARMEKNVSERRQLSALLSKVWRWSHG